MSEWAWTKEDQERYDRIGEEDMKVASSAEDCDWMLHKLRAALAELQRRDAAPELREAFVHAIRFGLEAGSRNSYMHGRRYQRRAQRAGDTELHGQLSELLEKYRDPLEILRDATPPTPAPVASAGDLKYRLAGSPCGNCGHFLNYHAGACILRDCACRGHVAPAPAAGPGDSEGAPQLPVRVDDREDVSRPDENTPCVMRDARGGVLAEGVRRHLSRVARALNAGRDAGRE